MASILSTCYPGKMCMQICAFYSILIARKLRLLRLFHLASNDLFCAGPDVPPIFGGTALSAPCNWRPWSNWFVMPIQLNSKSHLTIYKHYITNDRQTKVGTELFTKGQEEQNNSNLNYDNQSNLDQLSSKRNNAIRYYFSAIWCTLRTNLKKKMTCYTCRCISTFSPYDIS